MLARKLKTDDLLLAMLTSKSQRDAAKLLGVSEQTICKRIRAADFKEKFSEYRKGILDATRTRLINNSVKAVDVLISLLDSESEVTRYNASSKILQITNDYISMQDIVRRLDEIEKNIQ